MITRALIREEDIETGISAPKDRRYVLGSTSSRGSLGQAGEPIIHYHSGGGGDGISSRLGLVMGDIQLLRVIYSNQIF